MASGPISMGDQLIRSYDVTLTNYLSDCIAPRYVVINKPGFYTITITGSATGDSGSYWYGMCVIYNDPADVSRKIYSDDTTNVLTTPSGNFLIGMSTYYNGLQTSLLSIIICKIA
jgi:hypothetical protein